MAFLFSDPTQPVRNKPQISLINISQFHLLLNQIAIALVNILCLGKSLDNYNNFLTNPPVFRTPSLLQFLLFSAVYNF